MNRHYGMPAWYHPSLQEGSDVSADLLWPEEEAVHVRELDRVIVEEDQLPNPATRQHLRRHTVTSYSRIRKKRLYSDDIAKPRTISGTWSLALPQVRYAPHLPIPPNPTMMTEKSLIRSYSATMPIRFKAMSREYGFESTTCFTGPQERLRREGDGVYHPPALLDEILRSKREMADCRCTSPAHRDEER